MKNYGFCLSNTYTNLPNNFFERVQPAGAPNPRLTVWNEGLADRLGLDFSGMGENDKAHLFAGNRLPDGAEPFAQAYAGHQFGHFTILGDGRALILGEHVTPDGKRVDIQFKGSGRTPYSRRGDGRAALAPMLREYIISEAMHALNIPTTRSLAVVATGDEIMRDGPVPGAILTRVAASHIRVGTFEYAAAQGDLALINALLDYTIGRHAPQLKDTDGGNKALAFLRHVTQTQVDLIVHWMRVGFIHGVMNTDNMAVSGETIDYGPCAFMDSYGPNTVFSSIDHGGRYAFANQPRIAQWNIARLAEALLPLIHSDIPKAVALAEKAIHEFGALYERKWQEMMRMKLGLFGEQPGDEDLLSDFLDWMEQKGADYTNSFLDLGGEAKPSGGFYNSTEFSKWYERWQGRLKKNPKPLQSSLCLMRSVNPAIIPRNHKVEEALNAANEGDLKPVHDLLAAIQEPYKNRDSLTPYQSPPQPAERVYQTFCGT